MTAKENDLATALPKFCLALEQNRRTADGRVRSATEFREHFFSYDAASSTDRIFRRLPRDVRGPIISSWGIRGPKMALKDSDEQSQAVVHDALRAGDIDDEVFERCIEAPVVIRWTDLPEWWAFWRGGKLSKHAIRAALESAYELGLFDAKWFLDNLQARRGALRGTDVLAEGLSKADVVEWIKSVQQSGDGSPKGLLEALGWAKIAEKTHDAALIAVLDAFAEKNRLGGAGAAATEAEPRQVPTGLARFDDDDDLEPEELTKQIEVPRIDGMRTSPPESMQAGSAEPRSGKWIGDDLGEPEKGNKRDAHSKKGSKHPPASASGKADSKR
jgi:hypothetical protein